MKLQDIINKLMQSSDKEIFKNLNAILKYENIKFTPDMFFASTPVYLMQFKNPITGEEEEWNEPLYLKHVIPDFMIENFATMRREDTKIMNDFLKIFLIRVFILNFIFIIKKNQNLYLSPIKSYQYAVTTINNRKNLEYFFKNFFKRKIKIVENIPERFENSNQFKLGESRLTSNAINSTSSIGTLVFTALNKYSVHLDIGFEELDQLENCIWALTQRKMLILKSNPNSIQIKKGIIMRYLLWAQR